MGLEKIPYSSNNLTESCSTSSRVAIYVTSKLDLKITITKLTIYYRMGQHFVLYFMKTFYTKFAHKNLTCGKLTRIQDQSIQNN